MGRRTLALFIALGLLGVFVAGAMAVGKPAAHQRAARHDAVSLLTRLLLPAGAIRVADEPRADSGLLRPPRGLLGSTAQVIRHAWFTVPGTPAEVLAYIEGHPPRGGRVDSTGAINLGATGASAQSVTYAFANLRGRIDARELQVTVTGLSAGRTGVLAESDSVWFVPRPTGERVPAGVRRVEVTAGVPGRAPSRAVIVVNPATIRRIVRLVDQLAPAQPFAINCPAETDPRQIKVRFLGAAAVTLASLDIVAFRPWTAVDNGGCGASLTFTVRGHRQAPLVAGAIVRDLQRILGISLA
jgi:hypothetical protein